MCGLMRHSWALNWGRAREAASYLIAGVNRAVLAVIVVGFASIGIAEAQDPSIKTQPAGNGRTFNNSASTMFGAKPAVNAALPLYLQGDQLVYDTKGKKVIARGNVEIFYNNFVLTADEIIYDQGANLLTAQGNATLRDPNGNITRADRLQATDDFRDAFVQSLSVVSKDETRIAARRATRRDGNTSEYEQAKFTPCKNDAGKPPLWCISAARIVHDQKAATITYQDAAFEFFGMPVLYLPYFSHADPSVKRKSGFLAPHIGSSTTLGFRFEVPYYFALSPNYDFTFSPEYMSKQGVMYKGEYRQRLANGQYTVRFGAIDQDITKLAASGEVADPKLDGWRGTVETRGVFSLSSWWKAGWDVTLESDKSFRRFYGFDTAFQTDRVNTAYLTGMSERNYFNAQFYHFGGLLLDDSVTASSRVHPVIDYNYIFNGKVLGGELSFNGHARDMTRRNSTDSLGQPVSGTDTTHAVAEVAWRRQVIDSIGQTWTPFAAVRGDAYSFQNARDPLTGLTIDSDSVLRGIGTAGLTYAYPFVAHTPSASHIIEPTVQVVSRHANSVDQRLLPNEDAKSLVFDDTLLFDVSKTSGFDRIDTGTRLNTGLQYTFQANNGFHAKAVFGQSFQLAGENIFTDPGKDVTSTTGVFGSAFDPRSGLGTTRSDYVAGLYISPLKNLSVVTQGRFDSEDWTLRRQDSLLTVGFGPITTQAVYTFRQADPSLLGDTNQHDAQLTVGLKLTDNWTLLGQMRYDIDEQRRIQDSLGLRYADECFVLTGTLSETFIENTGLGIKPDRSVMLRFELKHLGEFNYQTDVTSFFGRGENQPAQ
jgi:LPS-assembly protein